MTTIAARRRFLKTATAAAITTLTRCLRASTSGFRPLFDGKTLTGWTPKPRGKKSTSLGSWTVTDGYILAGQNPVGAGAYLVSDEAFADFELELDVRPDWPADTGVYVRTTPDGATGLQVNIDYRPHGSLGGYYGNQLGSFHAYTYAIVGRKDTSGKLVGLASEKPAEPNDALHRVDPDFMAPFDVLRRIWVLNGWNRFRIRSVGPVPTLTTWINGVRISELNTAKMVVPGWEPGQFLAKVGRSGHISLETHNNVPADWLGNDRWAPGAVCRWRNIRIRTL